MDRLEQIIERTRASIHALTRQRDGVQRQIEIQKVRLQAYLDLKGDTETSPSAKPTGHSKQSPLFVSSIPWDRVFGAIRETVKNGEFGAAEVNAQLSLGKIAAPSSTIRSKLAAMVEADELIWVSKGRYRFPVAAKK